MDWIFQLDAWVALLTLTVLEVVLGIDNLVFISIQSGRLPPEQRSKARRIGLLLAMAMRIALLFAINFIMRLQQPWFSIGDHAFTGKDVILLAGGLFLLWKSTTEIHHKLEGDDVDPTTGVRRAASFGKTITSIMLLDLVFSIDSVITAVGMAGEYLAVMVIAVLISVGVMVAFVNPICAFVERHPTVKMLALSFLLLIGFTLVGEGCGMHIPKGYVYFAMGFSVGVEFLNLRLRKAGKPVNLHGPETPVQ
jgi:predicted tellurium resistance membrane protein TerC